MVLATMSPHRYRSAAAAMDVPDDTVQAGSADRSDDDAWKTALPGTA
jgi:hypothetical protein